MDRAIDKACDDLDELNREFEYKGCSFTHDFLKRFMGAASCVNMNNRRAQELFNASLLSVTDSVRIKRPGTYGGVA